MNNWKDILVREDTPILETMKKIDQAASQFAVVVDDHFRLKGTVTDGDVRRGLLHGKNLSDSVMDIMNKEPIKIYQGDNADRAFHHSVVQRLPVVTSANELVDVIFKEQFSSVTSKPNKVVLMAGGLGTRLRPLTEDTPKPLLQVGGKPILETILENFISHGFKEFYICVNYKKDMIKEYFQDGSYWGATINYIDENERLGTAGALSLLNEEWDEPFFVMNGDLLTTINVTQLLDFHYKQNSQATMCVREYEYQIPYGVIRTEGSTLKAIDEKPHHKEFVNAGIYVLDPFLLKYIPNHSFYDMPDLYHKVMEKQHTVTAFPLREYWLDIGRYADYERALNEYNEVF